MTQNPAPYAQPILSPSRRVKPYQLLPDLHNSVSSNGAPPEPSRRLHLTTSDLSASTQDSYNDQTPPTSQSQEGQSLNDLETPLISPVEKPSISNGTHAQCSTSPNRCTGTKRKASGILKSPITSTHVRHHSRNISLDSNASRVSEVVFDHLSKEITANGTTQLSSQLRTRLSYAMVKVQNGWEKNSFSDIEPLASQAISPVSPSYSNNKGVLSPRAAMANANRRSRDLSAVTSPEFPALNSAFMPLTSRAPDRKLAPAAELRSMSKTNGLDSGSASPHFSAPYTRTVTPTKEEQDAVDSLLSMSSPSAATTTIKTTHFPMSRSKLNGHSPRRNEKVAWQSLNGVAERPGSSGSSAVSSLVERASADWAATKRSHPGPGATSAAPVRSIKDVDRLVGDLRYEEEVEESY